MLNLDFKFTGRVHSLIESILEETNAGGTLEPYLKLKYVLDHYFPIVQALPSYFFEDFSFCCASYYQKEDYTRNSYCFFDLLISYGLNPLAMHSCVDGTIQHYFKPERENWAHIYKLFCSPFVFDQRDFMAELIACGKLDLIETLLINSTYEPKHPLRLNECPEFQIAEKNIQNEVLKLIERYKPVWII